MITVTSGWFSKEKDYKQDLIQQLKQIGFNAFDSSSSSLTFGQDENLTIMNVDNMIFSDQLMTKRKNNQFVPTGSAVVAKISVRKAEEFSTSSKSYVANIKATKYPQYKNRFMSITTNLEHLAADITAAVKKLALELRSNH